MCCDFTDCRFAIRTDLATAKVEPPQAVFIDKHQHLMYQENLKAEARTHCVKESVPMLSMSMFLIADARYSAIGLVEASAGGNASLISRRLSQLCGSVQ
jgi:hypothetical protein